MILTNSITLRLSDGEAEALASACDANGATQSEIIRAAIRLMARIGPELRAEVRIGRAAALARRKEKMLAAVVRRIADLDEAIASEHRGVSEAGEVLTA